MCSRLGSAARPGTKQTRKRREKSALAPFILNGAATWSIDAPAARVRHEASVASAPDNVVTAGSSNSEAIVRSSAPAAPASIR